jgi:hypothetical protein
MLVSALALCCAQGAELRPSETAPQVRRETVQGKPAQPVAYDELVKKYDKNGDGKLDDQEIAAVRSQMRVEQPRFSTTNEGSITVPRELVNAPVRPRNPNSRDFFEKYDLNGDGKLDARELEAAKADMHTGQPSPLYPDKSPRPTLTVPSTTKTAPAKRSHQPVR